MGDTYKSIAKGAADFIAGDRNLPETHVPADVAILAPLGAVAFALVGVPLVALKLVAISACPRVVGNTFSLISSTKRLGAFAKVFLQGLLVVVTVVVLPPSALIAGGVIGLCHGLYLGWQFFAAQGHTDLLRYPTELWSSEVRAPSRADLA